MDRHSPADNAAPYFLAMMVRATRAVDLLADSGLVVPPWHGDAGTPPLT